MYFTFNLIYNKKPKDYYVKAIVPDLIRHHMKARFCLQ